MEREKGTPCTNLTAGFYFYNYGVKTPQDKKYILTLHGTGSNEADLLLFIHVLDSALPQLSLVNFVDQLIIWKADQKALYYSTRPVSIKLIAIKYLR